MDRTNGDREWYVAGNRHRLDGPAVEWPNEAQHWWVDGVRHRDGGPAIEEADGTQTWYWHGWLCRWVLPLALWLESAARRALWEIEDPHEQRAAALALLPTLAPELQRATVAEALADPDPDLRLWGLRAAAVVGRLEQGVGAVLDDAAVERTSALQPTPRLR